MSHPPTPSLPSPPSSSLSSDRSHRHHLPASPPLSSSISPPSPALSPLSRVIRYASLLPVQTEDLVITDISANAYRALLAVIEYHNTVGGKATNSIRHYYDPFTCVFKLKCMHTAVHDAIITLCTRMYGLMFLVQFFSFDEYNQVHLYTGTDHVLPSRRPGHKPTAMKKQPDAAFSFGASSTKRAFPTVVFEVAFTESYVDVLEDARHWLVTSAGRVRLVVLVKLTEEKATPAPLPPDEDDNYHTSTSDSNSNSTASVTSDPDAYQTVPDNTPAAGFVGPITGFIELWRYDTASASIRLDGARHAIPPPGAALQPSVISFTKADIKGDHAGPGDAEKSWNLDLRAYRELLEDARRRLAYTRRVYMEKSG